MADTTDKVIRLTEYDLLRTAKTPGNYYATTDGRKLYRDESSTVRTLVDAVQIPTEKQRLYDSFQKIYGKLYYVWESSVLYIWNNRWEVLKGNPDYPSAFQYIDGEIYDVGDMTSDVKGNGILGDGSVVIRDVNRIIKAKLYIDETNDNLVIASFLGGGIKVLPNGNMENTGALYLNPTTIGEQDIDGLGQHYCQFENINGEMYVIYDSDHWHVDENKYKDLHPDHRYLVWHQGNLDATPLIEGWYLLKDIDDGKKGKTHIENTEESKGLLLQSENPDLNSKTTFATHHDNLDNAPILNELTGEEIGNPTNNAGLYTVVRENGDIEIHLRKDKLRPLSEKDLDDNDKLLTKGEIVELMNEKVYLANRVRKTNSLEEYVINDESLVPLIKEGLVISVRFSETSETESVSLKIGNDGAYEIIDLNLDNTVKKRPIGFVKDNIYQLIRFTSKWIVINAEMRANYEVNGYGLVRVTGESSDTSSFNVIMDSNVDLNDTKYQYDGKYSFINNITNFDNFPEEEREYVTDNGMEYTLEVNSSSGRGAGVNSDDNFLEQILTNVGTGRKYVRYLNKTWELKDEFEQGGLDNNGRNLDNNLEVRQTTVIKANKNSSYRFKFFGLTGVVQCSVARLTKDGCSSKSSYMNTNSMTPIITDSDTKFLRLVFRYQNTGVQLNPSLINNSTIIISQVGFSEWTEIYNDSKLTNRERISTETLSLTSGNWKKDGDSYSQTFYRWFVDENTLVEGNLDINNQKKLEVSHTESFNYGFKIVSIAKPTENINITMTYTDTKEV